MSLAPLGILAGGGSLPLTLAEACRAERRPYLIMTFEGSADMAAFEDHPHHSARIGAVGEVMQHLRQAEIQTLVLAGHMRRPSLASLKPDAEGKRLMARLGRKLFSGDDALLSALVAFLEEEGFRVIGAEEVTQSLLTPKGALSRMRVDTQARSDIALGLQAARQLGSLDIGQAVIIENGYVLGVEAAEGTDALIQRCAGLMQEAKRAVLIKAAKPGQERRADLPSAGLATLEALRAANMLGLAVEAGNSLLLGREAMVAYANEHGLLFTGIEG